MADAANKRTGRCLCGAVRFSAVLESMHYELCHCEMCRKWTSGPFFAIDCGTTVAFDDEASLGAYKSSDWAHREFCQACGTTLFYRLDATGQRIASISAFDESADFVLTGQIFIDEKPAHYAFANETRNMTGAEVFAQYAPKQDD